MGTKSYVNDDSMVYNPNTGTYSRAGDIRAGSGVLTQQAQDEAALAQLIATLEAEAEEAAAAKANTGGPKTDFPGINRDPTSDSIGGYAVDLGSVYSLFPDPVTGAVSAAMQNDYLNSLLEEGQYKGLSTAERLDLFTELQATNAPRFISSEEGIRPATEQETEDFYDNIIDYLLGLGSVPTSTETETETETTTGPTLLEKAQAQANKIGAAIGTAQDRLFDILGIPRPDYSVIQPNAPGGTVIWGQPSGGVFGRVGVTPGGTTVGVQTGIPALDILLGKTADIISGRVSAGEILTPETIEDIVVETAGAELGIPSSSAGEIIAGAKNAAKAAGVYLDKETGKLGVDLSDGANIFDTDRTPPTLTTDRVSPTLTTDRVSPTLTTDRATTLTTDRASPTLTTDRATTLTTDRAGEFDPTYTERATTDRATTLTTDRADEVPGGGSAGGVGVGGQGGIRTASGAPGPSVDIDYLYDFARGLEQPFQATDDEEEGDKVKRFQTGGTTGTAATGATTTTSNLPFGLSEKQFGLLGAAVGGLFGGLGGSGDTQGSQGYTGGIPALTASREIVPDAFAMEGRRPGEAGRRYFTDVQYTPVTDEAGLPTIMGGAELAAMNQAALDRQQELTELGQGLLGLYGQQLATTPTGDTTGQTTDTTGQTTGQTTGTDATTSITYTGSNLDELNTLPLYDGPQQTAQTYNKDLVQLPRTNLSEANKETLRSLIGTGTISFEEAARYFNAIDSSGGIMRDKMSAILNPASSNASGRFSREERDSVAEEIISGRAGITDVADRYEGVSDIDVIENLIRQGDQTPAQIADRYDEVDEPKLIAALLEEGKTTPEEVAAYYKDHPVYGGITPEQVKAAFTDLGGTRKFARGGEVQDDLPMMYDENSNPATADRNYNYLTTKYNMGPMDPASEEGRREIETMERKRRRESTRTPIEYLLDMLNTGKEGAELRLGNTSGDRRRFNERNPGFLRQLEDLKEARERILKAQDRGYAQGGLASVAPQGMYLGGPTDGMADQIPATINNMEPARLSDGEFVIPADVVSHLGNGNSDAGAKNLYSMMERVRKDRTGNPKQGKQIDPNKYLA